MRTTRFPPLRILYAFLLVGVTAACGGKAPVGPGAQANLFDRARSALERDKYSKAANLAWRFLRHQQEGGENVENAEFILARSLDQLEYDHAAVEYYTEVVRHGASSELITESLASVSQIMEELPYDQHLVEVELFGASEFDFLTKELQSSVSYTRGKVDSLRGDHDWARNSFARIEPETIASYKVRYSQGVQELQQGRPDQAIEIFQEVSTKAPKKTEIRNRSLQSLGRMLYEEKDYQKALDAYNTIDSSVLLWDEVFLEKAWNTYQLKSYSRALGYLHALNAPIFEKSFQPERYLLLGMTLRRLCQYLAVRTAIAEFREIFGGAVQHVRNGRLLKEHEQILQAARTKSSVRAVSHFLDFLETEKKKLTKKSSGGWKGSGLRSHLKRLYDLKIRENRMALRDNQEKALAEVAEQLLYYNEQMNLLEYEVRMDEFRHSRFSDMQPQISVAPRRALVSEVIHWKYKREFWIDELNTFSVKVESLCEE